MSKVADLAAALIRVFEGCRLEAYQDSGGVWTIGFGHTQGVRQGDTCTMEQATEWLSSDAAPLFDYLRTCGLVNDHIHQAAYMSFGYNCGFTSLRHVIGGSARLSEFIHDRHGNVLPGLVARRALEQALIDS